jgi:hypothetical protein
MSISTYLHFGFINRYNSLSSKKRKVGLPTLYGLTNLLQRSNQGSLDLRQY